MKKQKYIYRGPSVKQTHYILHYNGSGKKECPSETTSDGQRQSRKQKSRQFTQVKGIEYAMTQVKREVNAIINGKK